MEHAVNGSLSDLFEKVENHNIPSNYTKTTRQIIIIGICHGMKYLHENNIFHCNLTPSNILLDCDYHPYLTDFYGISNQEKSIEKLAYKAPEVLQNKKCDNKADVYSFGILMYQLITDSKLFPELSNNNKKTYSDFKRKIIDKNYRPDLNKPMKSSLKQLIEQCLSKNSNERPSFDELFEKLTNKNELKTDENYFLDKVNINQLKCYIESITSQATFD